MRCIVNRVTLRDVAKVCAVSVHDGQAGVLSLALQYASNACLLAATGSKSADAKIGRVQQTPLVAGAIAEKKNPANVIGREAVKQFAGLTSRRDSCDGYTHLGGIATLSAPQQSPGHKLGACTLHLPRVAVVDLRSTLAHRLPKTAIDRTHRLFAQFEVQLSLRQIGKGIAHPEKSLAEGKRAS
jgi:hypothetical protein